MTIIASSLYGSRARSDHSHSSDIDILYITTEQNIRHTQVGELSLSFYPLTDLEDKAAAGNMFLYHVLAEGIVIYDPRHVFQDLQTQFRFKKSYENEKQSAAGVAWLIVKHYREFANSPLLGKRIAWCARTLLISISAERQKPVFSSAHLAALAPEIDVVGLVAQKDQMDISGSIDSLSHLFRMFGLIDPVPNSDNAGDYKELFAAQGNEIGVKFLSSLANREEPY